MVSKPEFRIDVLIWVRWKDEVETKESQEVCSLYTVFARTYFARKEFSA